MIPIPILGFLEDTEKAALHCRMFCGFFFWLIGGSAESLQAL